MTSSNPKLGVDLLFIYEVCGACNFSSPAFRAYSTTSISRTSLSGSFFATKSRTSSNRSSTPPFPRPFFISKVYLVEAHYPRSVHTPQTYTPEVAETHTSHSLTHVHAPVNLLVILYSSPSKCVLRISYAPSAVVAATPPPLVYRLQHGSVFSSRAMAGMKV